MLGLAWFHQGGRTPQLPEGGRFLSITWPYAEQIHTIPIIGPLYAVLLSGHNLLVYVAFLARAADLLGAV